MKRPRYEIYMSTDGIKCFLKGEAEDVETACDKAYEIEKKSDDYHTATIIYDTAKKEWFGYHLKGTAYILAK